VKRVVIYILLSVSGISMMLPFYWMVVTSMKSPAEANRFPPTWIPQELQFSNYREAWREVPFLRYFGNTIFVTLCTVAGVIFTTCLAAYAFARMEFAGREFLFMLFLAMMMVPMPVYLVPGYLILTTFRWVDTYLALIVPWLANVFSIFLLRQHFKTIPQDLFDAATIDGCNRFQFLWRIMIPLSRNVLIAIILFSIIGSWNSFMWPLVMTNRTEIRPIQVGLAYFAQELSTSPTRLMAASTFCVAPLIILFFFAQRRIMESFARTGLKE
jgi:multiple sugar transport system permease protein